MTRKSSYKYGILQDNRNIGLLQIHTIKVYSYLNLEADAVVMVYDITDKQSFLDVDKFWLNEV